jgi:hypothetical protein
LPKKNKLSFISNFEEATTMNFYTPQATYSEGNSLFETPFPDIFSPIIHSQDSLLPPLHVVTSVPASDQQESMHSKPSDMEYDEFKTAIVALGLRNRPYDLDWEKNANQLQLAIQQAELQMVDHTCTAILYNCLSNQREEINFLKNVVYSFGKSMLNQKENEDNLKKKETKRVQRAATAAEKKKKNSLLLPPLLTPPPYPPTPPLKLALGKATKRPNTNKLNDNLYTAIGHTNLHEPVLKKKSKKNKSS